MHGYLVTYTEEKLRQYREAEGELSSLWERGRTNGASSRVLGFAAAGWWTLLMRKRRNKRRFGTSLK